MKYMIFDLLPSFGTNTYLLWDEETKEAVLIDPAQPNEGVLKKINELELNVKYIINTHGHGDHVCGNDFFAENLNAKVLIHEDDSLMITDSIKNLSRMAGFPYQCKKADKLLKDNDIIKIGNKEIKVIHTPGHTQGCVSFLVDNLLFSGDTLFAGSVGRSDFPGSSHQRLIKSVKEKLLVLPEETIVLPGHGFDTTIGDEKLTNPFVGIMSI